MEILSPTIPPPADSGRKYGGESAEARQARQRLQFLDAGLKLFGTEGYHATTVRGLCKEAGLTDRYFYKNFNNIEDLLVAVYNSTQDVIQAQVMQAVNQALQQNALDTVTSAALDTFFKAIENPWIARVCWLEVLGVSPRVQAMYMQRVQQYADLLLTVAQHLRITWSHEDDEAQFIALALIGAVSQSAMNWLLSGYRAKRSTVVAANTVILRGALAHLQTPIQTPTPTD